VEVEDEVLRRRASKPGEVNKKMSGFSALLVAFAFAYRRGKTKGICFFLHPQS
jgi:hypothetical protein